MMTGIEEWLTLKFLALLVANIVRSCSYVDCRDFFCFLTTATTLGFFFLCYSSSLPVSIASCYSLVTVHRLIEIIKKKKKYDVDILSLNDNHCWCMVFFIFSYLPRCNDTMSICTCCPLHVHTNIHIKLY